MVTLDFAADIKPVKDCRSAGRKEGGREGRRGRGWNHASVVLRGFSSGVGYWYALDRDVMKALPTVRGLG